MMPDPGPDTSQPGIKASTVIRNIGQLVTVAQQPIPGANGPLQVISHAALAVRHGVIVWIGPDNDAEPMFQSNSAASTDGITIIDADLRHAGISYGELLAQGRGILTTMNATRSADTDTLVTLAKARLDTMREHGTTTVEVKTGYGLDKITEETCLRIITNLNALGESGIHKLGHTRVVPTFLGAHTIPPEYREQRSAYVDLVVGEMLPSFVGMARFCDVFCEREAFTLEESRRILTRAKDLGYQLKIHADQLSPSGGARLAAELGAVSADHLDYASDADLDAMRDAGVVATLLPGSCFSLRSPYPSARRFIDRGLHVALATDFNPGTSYCENMQMMMGLAMSSMNMTLEEALMAATINGARALALHDKIGSVEVGKRCELTLWSINDYREIGYHFGVNLVQSVLVKW